MKSNRVQKLKGMTTRQKVTTVVVVIVVIILLWQVISLFKGTGTTSAPVVPQNTAVGPAGTAGAPMPPPMPKPKPAAVPPQQGALPAQDEAALAAMQQASQVQYIEALNQLQLLRLQRDIAQTNQAIMTAKLAAVTAQKSIVTILAPPVTPPTGAAYGQVLASPTATQNAQSAIPAAPITSMVNYTVVSVTYIAGRWEAVLGYQNDLYSAHVGDILPPDQSIVMAIDRSGVYLADKANHVRRKISLVPVI